MEIKNLSNESTVYFLREKGKINPGSCNGSRVCYSEIIKNDNCYFVAFPLLLLFLETSVKTTISSPPSVFRPVL